MADLRELAAKLSKESDPVKRRILKEEIIAKQERKLLKQSRGG